MKELRTEIEIDASPARVWQILTDFGSYGDWNPFLYEAHGKPEDGGKVDVTFRSGRGERTLHCKITKSVPYRELRWKYHVIADPLFSGEHIFTIEPLGPSHVRLVDREVFNGLLLPLEAKNIETESKPHFEAMDRALKERAEEYR